ncbi:TlpA family protein disulfide reductase [Undibacterium sp. CY18W]|uniref:TlpA family protein disulfide reductase n=1 Tax=Undibacterium hunanense TaxID=2762292 RepID=A0ABR6ZPY5_9BURK|nr:TlpA disulfide reductase family protein [Undibacterium hunanense]MBC3917654.1 TlpA family protein disulfide reductase [Undibacterium hunanense]
MNKKFISLAIVLGMLSTGLGIYAGNVQTTPKPPENKAVAQLMAQQFKDSDGKPQAMTQWQGHYLLVNFWATWCAPCVQEMPELSALQQELKGKKVQILGLGIDSPSNIAEFAKKYKISYPLFAAGMEGSELSRQLGNQAGGLPFTILIAPDGKVVKNYLGRLKMEELRADIAKFSSEK